MGATNELQPRLGCSALILCRQIRNKETGYPDLIGIAIHQERQLARAPVFGIVALALALDARDVNDGRIAIEDGVHFYRHLYQWEAMH
jgi:hypothetical protein